MASFFEESNPRVLRGKTHALAMRSEEMIFALKEKESDEMAFGANLYRQLAPPILVG